MDVAITIAVMVVLAGLLHLYVWARLVRGTMRTSRWRWVATAALAVAGAAMVVALLAEPLGVWPPVWLLWSGFLWLGVLFYLLVVLLVLELPVLVTRLVWRWRARRAQQRVDAAAATAALAPAAAEDSAAADNGAMTRKSADEADLSRRLLLRRGAAITAGLIAGGAASYGVAAAYQPVVRRVDVPLARLDRRADGLRIAVVADIHVGPLIGTGHVQKVVDMVNNLDADLVAVVGDMVAGDVESVGHFAEPLRRMRARQGSFFVTGNHEYYTGHEQWIEAADELGMRVLRNERLEILHGGGAIDLAGVNDREGSRFDDPPDYAAALADRDETRPVVLLAHQPVQVHRAAAYGVDLQLSGHTHGGQLFPFGAMVRLDQPVVSGLAKIDGTMVYVSNGAGFWGPPMRVGADPDVTLVRLRAS